MEYLKIRIRIDIFFSDTYWSLNYLGTFPGAHHFLLTDMCNKSIETSQIKIIPMMSLKSAGPQLLPKMLFIFQAELFQEEHQNSISSSVQVSLSPHKEASQAAPGS